MNPRQAPVPRGVPVASRRPPPAGGEKVAAPVTDRLDNLSQLARIHGASSALARLQRRADGAGTVQRTVIAQAQVAGLTADIDTADPDAAIAQIDALWGAGKRATLVALYAKLGTAYQTDTHAEENKAIRAHLHGHIGKHASDDANHGNDGFLARTAFDLTHWASDKTGMVDGRAPDPATATDEQTAAMGVRAWQAGDIVNQINWKTVGLYLQGRLTAEDYGGLAVQLRVPAKPGGDVRSDAQYEKAMVDPLIQGVADQIGAGLDALPKFEGKSYRGATSAAGVMGSQVNTGDLIKDQSFLSTSALRLNNGGHAFGTEGTPQAPKIYYIIEGSTGVFLPAFTDFETGVREVLFSNDTVFRVDEIHNYNNATYFVSITEVDPATLAPDATVKNPWTGTAY